MDNNITDIKIDGMTVNEIRAMARYFETQHGMTFTEFYSKSYTSGYSAGYEVGAREALTETKDKLKPYLVINQAEFDCFLKAVNLVDSFIKHLDGECATDADTLLRDARAFHNKYLNPSTLNKEGNI